MQNTQKKSKVGFVSLGCPKNQTDTEVMLKILADAGYIIVSEDIEADIIIINTCAFLESAKQEAIDNILDIAWLKKNRSLKGIIVTGCLAERYREQVLGELHEVDAIVGVFSLQDILAAVQKVEQKVKDTDEKFIFLRPQSEQILGGDRVLTTPEYMAYLKIAEGCNNLCTYCAIPKIRGKFVSRPIEDLCREARDLSDLGVRELVVVAQDTTRYGEDLYGEYKLHELLTELCKIEKLRWIRLLYCYPGKITDELIEVIKNNDKIVKYIDLPIQHINDRVLSAMNRKGGKAAILDSLTKLRTIPDMTVRTTVITGFPGETKEEFKELLDFISEVKFDRLGAFAYSPEEDTLAAVMEGQIPKAERERREKRVMQLQDRINYTLNQKKLNKTIEVLTEGYDKVSEMYYGRSSADAPEIDGKIYFASKNKKIKEGTFIPVKINEIVDYDLFGEDTSFFPL